MGVDRNGEEKVGQHGDLVVIPLQVDLLTSLHRLVANGEISVGLEVVEAVNHEARGEFEGEPVGDAGANGDVHSEAWIIGEEAGAGGHGSAAGNSRKLIDIGVADQ